MLLECRHCGAPLDVRAGERATRCRYCGTQSATQALRTVAAETPRHWRPPPRWTPPASAPADSHVTLPYRRASPVVVASFAAGLMLAVGAAVAVGVTARATSRGAAAPGARSPFGAAGVPVDRLASITLRERAEELAKLPGASLDGARLRVPLSSAAWTAITFEWDPAHPEHVRQFFVNCPSPHPAYAQTRSRLEKLLPKRWSGDGFRWEGVSLYFGASGGVLSVNVDEAEGSGDRTNPRWKQQAEAMWSVVQSAALELPVKVDAAAVREFLGGGYPLTALSAIDFDADVDASAAAVAKVFPGAAPEKHIALTYTIALDHPWLGAAELQWKNARKAKMTTVHLRPAGNGTILEHQDEIAACVAAGFNVKAQVNESDYLAKQKDYIYEPAGGGEIRVYQHLVKIELRDYPFAPPMPKAIWDKTLAVLDRCGRPAR